MDRLLWILVAAGLAVHAATVGGFARAESVAAASPSHAEARTTAEILPFLGRALREATHWSPGEGARPAAEADVRSGRYAFGIWYRGRLQHQVALILPARAQDAPRAYLWTRDMAAARPIALEAFFRLVRRPIEQASSGHPEVRVSWHALSHALPLTTGEGGRSVNVEWSLFTRVTAPGADRQ